MGRGIGKEEGRGEKERGWDEKGRGIGREGGWEG